MEDTEQLRAQAPAPPAPQTDAPKDAPDEPDATERERALREERERDARARAALEQQAERVKARYPAFDMAREARDEGFRRMLRAGLTVEQAFEAVHHRDIVRAAAEAAARRARDQTRREMESLSARADENGLAGQGARPARDVSRLSRRERDELERRAMRGERVTL